MSKEITFTETTVGSMKYLYYDPNTVTNQSHRELIRKNGANLSLVPYSHQMPDGFETLCYELGEVHHGLIPLVYVFHKKRLIKLEELLLLMHGIVSTVLNGTKLGLLENSFILNPKHIFMKRNSAQPQLVYVPASVDTSLQAEFKQLLQYLSNVNSTAHPLTAQMLAALTNVTNNNFNLRDIATIIVQAANDNKVDEKYLHVQAVAPQAAPKGLFKRIAEGVTGAKEEVHDDHFADFDERTVLSITDISGIDMNIAALYVVENDVRTLQIPITKDSFVLGRTRGECDHCFEERSISRVHAVIDSNVMGEYTVTDKDSSGGTFVNGARIVPNHPVPLKQGDILTLHKKKLMFECGN